jgi:predicted GNAT family acetyltransferase
MISLGGKGVGLQLLNTAVEYARTHNVKIVPLCPFAKSMFDKKPELRDVLLRKKFAPQVVILSLSKGR